MKKKQSRTNNKRGHFLYADLADRIQAQIETGAFKLSEKLPSLRALRQKTGYSMTTVFQAYVELEKRGVVESRSRCGYFIKVPLQRLRHPPEMKRYAMEPREVTFDDLIHQLTEDMGNPDMLKLGSVAAAPHHLPTKRLHKHLKSIPIVIILLDSSCPMTGKRNCWMCSVVKRFPSSKMM